MQELQRQLETAQRKVDHTEKYKQTATGALDAVAEAQAQLASLQSQHEAVKRDAAQQISSLQKRLDDVSSASSPTHTRLQV